MKTRAIRLLSGGVSCAVIGLAHYTWVAPSAKFLAIGKPTTIQIGHGHAFPESEEAIDASQIDAFAVSPSGARAKLQPVKSGDALSAEFAAKERGLHRIAFVQDRGVNSRTPGGLKPGGRDKNPNATQAYRTLRTAVAYARTSESVLMAGKPLGIEFELTGTLAKGIWSIQLFRQSKPVEGVTIEVIVAGTGTAHQTGKTDSIGRVSFQPSTSWKEPAMFSAVLKEPAQGQSYEYTNYETSLHVSW